MGQESVVSKESSSITRLAIFPWVIFGLGALFYCYEYLLRISPSVMTNDLMSSFSINAGVLGNLIAYYYYVYTPMQLPVGVLMDRYGPRRLLVVACTICVLGAFWFGTTHSAASIGFARLLIGLGSAFAFVGVLKIASLWLPENHFALASGLALMLGMTGAMVGDDIMASLVDHVGWRDTVIYAAYAGIGLILLFILILRDHPTQKTKNPVLPETTFRKLWPEIVTLVKNPFIWLNGLIGGLMYLPISAFAELWGVPFIQNTYHMTRSGAASAIAIMFLGVAFGGPIAGFVSDYLRQRRLPVFVGGILSGILGLVLIFIPGLPKEILYATLFFFGMVSSIQVLVFPIGREISPDDLGGTAVAFTNMLVMVGGVIFQPLIGVLLDSKWNGLKIHGAPVYTSTDYKYALFAIPVAMFLGVILMMFMPETHAEVKEEGVNA